MKAIKQFGKNTLQKSRLEIERLKQTLEDSQ